MANPTKNLKVGDLVLLQDESLPRGMWPQGLMKEVKFSRDDLVRVPKLKLAQLNWLDQSQN